MPNDLGRLLGAFGSGLNFVKMTITLVKLARATVQNPQTGELEPADYRVSKR
jgi:hypothetical protein